MAASAAEHSVAVVGGNVSRAPSLTLAITVVGHADTPDQLVLRSGARAGDLLTVTGELGGAAAGLMLLERPELGDGLADGVTERLRERQLVPEPRLEAGRALAASGASAMIDISDGLGGDAGHLAEASGVQLVVELDRLPLQEGVEAVAAAAGIDALDLAAGRGEDYELLATVPPEGLDRARRALEGGAALTPIGAAREGAGVILVESDGSERRPSGFDQLAG